MCSHVSCSGGQIPCIKVLAGQFVLEAEAGTQLHWNRVLGNMPVHPLRGLQVEGHGFQPLWEGLMSLLMSEQL